MQKIEKIEWRKLYDGLPPVGQLLVVKIFDKSRNTLEFRQPVIYRKSIFDNNYGFYMFGIGENSKLENGSVLEWSLMPTDLVECYE